MAHDVHVLPCASLLPCQVGNTALHTACAYGWDNCVLAIVAACFLQPGQSVDLLTSPGKLSWFLDKPVLKGTKSLFVAQNVRGYVCAGSCMRTCVCPDRVHALTLDPFPSSTTVNPRCDSRLGVGAKVSCSCCCASRLCVNERFGNAVYVNTPPHDQACSMSYMMSDA